MPEMVPETSEIAVDLARQPSEYVSSKRSKTSEEVDAKTLEEVDAKTSELVDAKTLEEVDSKAAAPEEMDDDEPIPAPVPEAFHPELLKDLVARMESIVITQSFACALRDCEPSAGDAHVEVARRTGELDVVREHWTVAHVAGVDGVVGRRRGGGADGERVAGRAGGLGGE